jgi:L-iditol 2-dehydrogenase
MQALVYTDLRRVEMQERPEPALAPDDVLLKVRGTGICGSDMVGFLGLSPRRQPGLVLGHETVATVARMPQSAPPNGGEWPFQIGDRVVINPFMPCGACDACKVGRVNVCTGWRLIGMDKIDGTFAEWAKAPAANVFPIPDSLSDERAIMIEPLANGVHLFSLIRQHHFGTLAIFGAGTQGCLLISVARLLGYRDIAIVDVNAARLGVAAKLGAKHLINARETDSVTAIRDCFGGKGADIVIEAYGDTATRAASVQAVRRGGEILLLGLHEVMSSVDFTTIVRHELRLQGSFVYTDADFARSKALIESGDVDLSPWTLTYPLAQGQEAFDKLLNDPGPTMKIVLAS